MLGIISTLAFSILWDVGQPSTWNLCTHYQDDTSW